MTLTALSERVPGDLVGTDVEFSGISTDTRTLQPGDAFLALSGERFDGNAYVGDAERKGAVAAIAERVLSEVALPVLRVNDAKAALGALANLNRRRSTATVIALTGSQGKTTVKELTGKILSGVGSTLITHANLNNTIGVPLTLLRLEQDHRFAVIEMGADRAGEIAFCVTAAEPDLALITNASPAHIEGFGSLQGIVEAKGEIIDGVKPTGRMILNADDGHVDQWIERAQHLDVSLFSGSGESSDADYHAVNVDIRDRGQVGFTLQSPGGSCDIALSVLGRHNVGNAVAAAALAMEAGAGLEDVRRGLQAVAPVQGRLQAHQGINGCRVLDDTYNASPDSFAAAIDVLKTFEGHKILVAGDMNELGSESEQAHRYVGQYAAAAGIDRLWATGDMSRIMVDEFGDRGRHFQDKLELLAACTSLAEERIVFLVKGSRGMKMESVVQGLTQSGGI